MALHPRSVLAYINNRSEFAKTSLYLCLATQSVATVQLYHSLNSNCLARNLALNMRNILGLLIIFTIASSNISFGFGQCQTTINVLDYGAAGDGKTDDSEVS